MSTLCVASACGGDDAAAKANGGGSDDSDESTNDTGGSSDDGDKPSSSRSDASTAGKSDAGKVDAGASSGSDGGTTTPAKGDASSPGNTGTGDASSPGNTGNPGSTGSGESSCLDGITDYESDGPFQYDTTSSGAIKLWVPKTPAGCKVPVVHLANGTGATCAAYLGALTRLASHGFITACYEDTNTGAGTQGLMALDAVLQKYPDQAAQKFGSTGHSQGGQAAFTVLQLAEAKYPDFTMAGLAMEPASGFGTQPSGGTWQQVYAKIKSPMFMFSGTADMLVAESWVKQAYDAMPKSNEVYWWSATGATHIPTPVGPEQQVSIPWFRWKLLGDSAACTYFKAMPGNGMWEERASENAAPCQ